MNWRNKKVLVTGAGGFIGSHLVERLVREGARVRALVRYNSRSDWGHLETFEPRALRRIEVVSGDVTDARFVSEIVKGRDTVFHLAAQIAIPYSYVAPSTFVDTNVNGTLHVLEACRQHKTRRMVHTSTSEVYGTAQYAPIDEKHPLQGQSPYSASKIGADKLAESYHRSFGLPVVTVRPFNTYGPRQSARAVIPTVITQLLSGAKRLKLGSLSPVRDFNYVEDTVDGFLRAAAAPRALGETINIGSGKGWTIRETIETIMKLTARRVPLSTDRARIRPAKSEVFKLLCDARKAKRLAGWWPRFTLQQGLVRTVEYIREHLSDYKSGRYNI